MKNQRALKRMTVLALILILTLSFVFPFSAENLSFAAAEYPEAYLSQWYDADKFLDYENSLIAVNSLMSVLTAEDKAALAADPIIVAVIDTGVNYNHEVFKDVLYKKDGVMVGYDFYANDNNPMDDCTSPDSHGTHVAGIIAAEIIKYNLTDYVKIMPIRAGNTTGDFNSRKVTNALNYAVEKGADVVNMSFRGTMNDSSWNANSDFNTAIQAAFEQNVMLIAAAGNTEGADTSPSKTGTPAALEHVIGVMAYDRNGLLKTSYNYGESYDVVAPGVRIFSAVRSNYVKTVNSQGESDGYLTTASGDHYALKDGTSMATPLVSFMAAVLMIKHDRSASVVEYTINNMSTKTISNKYKKALLTDYLAYDPVSEIAIEKTDGNLSQSILNPSEIAFSATAKYFSNSETAPLTDPAYADILWYVYRCNKSGTVTDTTYVARGTGATYAYTPTEPGSYKVYASFIRNQKLTSNSVIINVEYASVDDVRLLCKGNTQVRIGDTYKYTVEGIELLDPEDNSVVWFVYKDNVLLDSANGNAYTFAPLEKGNYSIICKLTSNGATTTVKEFAVVAKMSLDEKNDIVGGVAAGIIIASSFGTLLFAAVKKILEKKVA